MLNFAETGSRSIRCPGLQLKTKGAWMRNFVSTTALALATVVFLSVAPASAAKTDKSEIYRLLELFGDVFERVRADYVEETSEEELVEAAIQGMLQSLDPHSSYLNKKTFKDMRVQTKGEFGGLGIEATMEGGYVKVVSPIDDTPAFRAGIELGDLITHLDGKVVRGLTLSQAVEKMRGKVGTDIVLTVRRKDVQPLDHHHYPRQDPDPVRPPPVRGRCRLSADHQFQRADQEWCDQIDCQAARGNR